MTAELDELDEINLGPNPPERPDRRSAAGRRALIKVAERVRAAPKWIKQLRSSKGQSALRKAKVTT